MPQRFFQAWRGLPPPVYSLLLVRTVTSSGSFVQPFLVLLLTQNLGLDAGTAGLLLTLNGLAMVPGSLWGGTLVDRWGRRRVLVVSQLVSALLLVFCGFFSREPAVVALLMLSSLVASFGHPAAPAILTDVTPAPRRQDAFSLMYLGHNLGFALGTTVAGLLFAQARPWLFWGEAAALTLTALLVQWRLPETRPAVSADAPTAADDPAPEAEKAHEGGVWSALRSRPGLLIFCGCLAAIWLGYSQLGFALPLWLVELKGPVEGPPLFGLAMAATALLVLVFTPPLTRLAQGRSPELTIAVGAFLIAVGLAGIAGAGWPPLLWASAAVLTAGEVLWATGSPAYVANHSPVTHRGRFQAVLNALQSLGALSGPWAGGLAVGALGLGLLWPAAALVVMLAAGGLVLLHRKENP